MKRILSKLKKLGVTSFLPFNEICPDIKFKCDSYHGSMPAEKYDSGKDHFVPRNRDIFLSSKSEVTRGFYVTSSIHGTMRKFRAHHSHPVSVATIHAYGRTRTDAVNRWIEKYRKYQINNQ